MGITKSIMDFLLALVKALGKEKSFTEAGVDNSYARERVDSE